jgi:small GTP-binding protein
MYALPAHQPFAILISMPANLTPQYMDAEKRFKQAETVQEKIAALEEMMSTIPKHKGTEKLQAELKKKMSALRKESEHSKKTGRRDTFVVEREGARQIALVGAPNSGKSQLVRSLTHATPEVAEYPYTTRLPIPGMLVFENVRLQLVDLPPISPEYTESWVPQIIRNADAALWVIDLSDDDILDRLEETRRFLANAHTELEQLKVLMIGNKKDAPGSDEREAIVREIYQNQFPMTTISAATISAEGIEQFKRVVYDFLDVVRVYTKAPGKKPDFTDPYVVDRGSTVLQVAEKVHRDFVENLKYARIWGEGKVDGIMVPRDFVISEGDVLELHV